MKKITLLSKLASLIIVLIVYCLPVLGGNIERSNENLQGRKSIEFKLENFDIFSIPIANSVALASMANAEEDYDLGISANGLPDTVREVVVFILNNTDNSLRITFLEVPSRSLLDPEDQEYSYAEISNILSEMVTDGRGDTAKFKLPSNMVLGTPVSQGQHEENDNNEQTDEEIEQSWSRPLADGNAIRALNNFLFDVRAFASVGYLKSQLEDYKKRPGKVCSDAIASPKICLPTLQLETVYNHVKQHQFISGDWLLTSEHSNPFTSKIRELLCAVYNSKYTSYVVIPASFLAIGAVGPAAVRAVNPTIINQFGTQNRIQTALNLVNFSIAALNVWKVLSFDSNDYEQISYLFIIPAGLLAITGARVLNPSIARFATQQRLTYVAIATSAVSLVISSWRLSSINNQ